MDRILTSLLAAAECLGYRKTTAMMKDRTDACILTWHLCGVAGRTYFPNPKATLFDCSAGDSTQSILPHPSPRYTYQRMRSERSNETTDRRAAAGRMRRNVECISTQCIQFLVVLWWPACIVWDCGAAGAFSQCTALWPRFLPYDVCVRVRIILPVITEAHIAFIHYVLSERGLHKNSPKAPYRRPR